MAIYFIDDNTYHILPLLIQLFCTVCFSLALFFTFKFDTMNHVVIIWAVCKPLALTSLGTEWLREGQLPALQWGGEEQEGQGGGGGGGEGGGGQEERRWPEELCLQQGHPGDVWTDRRRTGKLTPGPKVQCSAVQCSTLHFIALHCIALHCIAYHCIAVQCSAVQCLVM